MNNKLLTYEAAVDELKRLETAQKHLKDTLAGRCFIVAIFDKKMEALPLPSRSQLQRELHFQAKEINMVLSVIHAYKQARKYYGKLKKLEAKVEKVILATKR